jgi:transketolase
MLVRIGEENANVVVLSADSQNSTRSTVFAERFPKRTLNFGIAEANMMSAAAGLAIVGKIPVVAGFGFLLSMRCAEQVRTDICYANLHVVVVSTASGLAMGTGGPTHHCNEDIAIMRSFPNMTVVVPASPIEGAIAAYRCILDYDKPVYLRLGRSSDAAGADEIYRNENFDYKIGKAIMLEEGNDLTFIATGEAVRLALNIARDLKREKGLSIRVLNMHTVKPIDEEAILRAAEETRGIVTMEEGTTCGGVGQAIASVAAGMHSRNKVPVVTIGINDEFCKIGQTPELWEEHGLSKKEVLKAVNSILN